MTRLPSLIRALCLQSLLVFGSSVAFAAPLESHIKSRAELEFGVVLYDYFQKNYFTALVEYQYNYATNNTLALSPYGRVMNGGMMLSYGMPEASEKLFNVLLKDTVGQDVSNRAWYFLAKIYYNKSEEDKANNALDNVQGKIPDDVFFDYYYLQSLIGDNPVHTLDAKIQSRLAAYLPGYPYLLFNLAVGELQSGNSKNAIVYLGDVADYSGKTEELSILADRAKNGLAQLAMESGRLDDAWKHLTTIRTNGLYSNRALLAYAWSAIQAKRYDDAVPALKLLNQRSIALPEVQESKVLLAHVYEQLGILEEALQGNITAEQDFAAGINQVAEARSIIDDLDVPREFVSNLEAIMSKSDWYSSHPAIDYQKLTPFLIDLMASNAFTEVLKELADLYTIRDNLHFWIARSDEHQVILTNASNKNFNSSLADFFKKSGELRSQLLEKKSELKSHAETLPDSDRQRMTALLENAEKELLLLNSKVSLLESLESAYKQPAHFQSMVADHHRRLGEQLEKTEYYIDQLEPVMRRLVNKELDKHEKRMRYYWAQSRLAKARLYDQKLLSLSQPAASSSEKKKVTQ